jgi:hypothetical protein
MLGKSSAAQKFGKGKGNNALFNLSLSTQTKTHYFPAKITIISYDESR